MKFFRYLYSLYLFLIWGIVFILFLETGTRIILLSANYLYKPYFDRQNRKVYNMLPLEEQKKLSKFRKLARPSAISSENKYSYTQSKTSLCSEEYELTLQGKMEARFDKTGQLVEWHGEPLIGWYFRTLLYGNPFGYYHPDWNQVIEYLKNPPDHPVSLKLEYIEIYAHKYNVEIIPDKDFTTLVIQEEKSGFPHSLNNPSTPITEETSWLVYWLMYKPNFTSPPPAIPTNNYGFRDKDVQIPKPNDVFRIVCVGGSTTEEGNDLNSTYPNRMEQKLQEYFHTDKIDAINCGICAIRSWGERIRINDYLQLQPDALVYYNAINDICYPYIAYWVSLPNPWKKILQKSAFLNRIFNYKLLPSDEAIAKHFRETTFRNLGAMNCACKKKGVQIFICSFAYPKLKWYDFIGKLYCDFNMRNAWLIMLDVDITYPTYLYVLNIYNRELKKFCEEEKIPYIPVAEEMNVELDHFCDVCHTTQLGLETKANIITSYIARWIEEQNILPHHDN